MLCLRLSLSIWKHKYSTSALIELLCKNEPSPWKITYTEDPKPKVRPTTLGEDYWEVHVIKALILGIRCMRNEQISGQQEC